MRDVMIKALPVLSGLLLLGVQAASRPKIALLISAVLRGMGASLARRRDQRTAG